MAPTSTSTSPEPCPEPGVDDDGSISSAKIDELGDCAEGDRSKEKCVYPEHTANAEEEEEEEEEEPQPECEPHVSNHGERDNPANEASITESERNVAEDGNTTNTTANGQSEKNIEEDGNTTNATANGNGQSEDNQLPPPSWPDVTYDQLVKYPKVSLRAQSYFDIQQIRAIKPVTLIIMGISVPNFPELETDAIVKLAIKRTKHQLYYPTDVLPTTKSSKPYLQKEILRRCILHNLEGMGEDATHNDIPKANLFRQKDGLRSGIPAYLPRPGGYTINQCIDWLKNNPLPEEEHEFILKSAKQWRQQVRDQICAVDQKTKEFEAALAACGDTNIAEEKEERTKTQAAATASATATTTTNNHLKAAFENYTNYLSTSNITKPTNYNTQPAPANVINFSHDQQIAAAVNMNNIQAQAINQYQNQLAALQTQLATTSNGTQFEINVSKDTFKFNASHFVAYPGFRERLHGHSYKASVKLIGSHQIGRDGYVLDFGCVKSVAKEVCKELNEYFLVPMLSEVLKITVEEDEDGDQVGKKVCGDCDENTGTPVPKKTKKRKRNYYPGSVTILCEDGSTFVFPRQDCLLLPIMHSTAEELAVYLYGKILQNLDAEYLRKRGVTVMEVTVSEAVGQDAVFRCVIPASGGKEFDVVSYISKEAIPVMPCATETEAAEQRKRNS